MIDRGTLALVLLVVGIGLITVAAFWTPSWVNLWFLGWSFILTAGYVGGKDKIRESANAHPTNATLDSDEADERVILRRR